MIERSDSIVVNHYLEQDESIRRTRKSGDKLIQMSKKRYNYQW